MLKPPSKHKQTSREKLNWRVCVCTTLIDMPLLLLLRSAKEKRAFPQRPMMMRFGWRLLDGRYRRDNTHLQHGLAQLLLIV